MPRQLWQYVDRRDAHNSGWWVLARLIQREDGTLQVETNTRGSVVSTQVNLTPEAAMELRDVLDQVL